MAELNNSGEISYINLNGEVRKIAGSGMSQELSGSIDAQQTLIVNLQKQTEDLEIALAATKEKLASVVQGLTSGSILEQTDNGLYFAVNKVQYSLILTPDIDKDTKNYSLDVVLYADGQKVTNNKFYARIYGMSNGTFINIHPSGSDTAAYNLIEGHCNAVYSIFYNSLTVMVYEGLDNNELICNSSISLSKEGTPQGIYSIEMISNKGFVRNKKDTDDIVITTKLFRNGVDVHDIVMAAKPFEYILYWYSPKEGKNIELKSKSGVFSISPSDIDSKTTFYCETDIDIAYIESEVLKNG